MFGLGAGKTPAPSNDEILLTYTAVRSVLSPRMQDHNGDSRAKGNVVPGTQASGGRYADSDREPEVAAPRTWLLSKGWRRIGLVDPAEVPGG